MKIIAIEGWENVEKAVGKLAGRKPEWFPDGFNGIHAVANPEFFAATHEGKIYFSNADDLVTGFKPASLLANAIEKTKAGEPLSFNEEYAVETLWHEILHNQGKHSPEQLRARDWAAIKGIVQLTARHTYPALASRFGTKASHQNAIISGGLSYQVETSNLRNLFAQLGVDESQAIERLRLLIAGQTSQSSMIGQSAKMLAEMSGKSADRIAVSLKWLSLEDGFRQKVEKKLAY